MTVHGGRSNKRPHHEIGALFSPLARATLTTAYRYTDPYLFDSSAFETTFAMTPTPYEKGITHTLATTSGIRT